VAKPKQLDLLLRSDYDPQACFARLAGQIDVQKRTLFSFSGFRGSKPVIGFISGNEFSLQKRRFWRNDFAPVLYARLLPAMKGALIEGYFDFRTEVLLFMRIWLILATLVGVPIVLVSLRRAMAGDSDAWMGVGIPIGLIAWGFVLPKIGKFFGASERDYLSRFVEQALAAGTATGERTEKTWQSSLR
jgi:hypothetical protein